MITRKQFLRLEYNASNPNAPHRVVYVGISHPEASIHFTSKKKANEFITTLA